jgi:ribosomal protein L5
MSEDDIKKLEEENRILKVRCNIQMMHVSLDQKELQTYQRTLETISGDKSTTLSDAVRLSKAALEQWRVRNGL